MACWVERAASNGGPVYVAAVALPYGAHGALEAERLRIHRRAMWSTHDPHSTLDPDTHPHPSAAGGDRRDVFHLLKHASGTLRRADLRDYDPGLVREALALRLQATFLDPLALVAVITSTAGNRLRGRQLKGANAWYLLIASGELTDPLGAPDWIGVVRRCSPTNRCAGPCHSTASCPTEHDIRSLHRPKRRVALWRLRERAGLEQGAGVLEPHEVLYPQATAGHPWNLIRQEVLSFYVDSASDWPNHGKVSRVAGAPSGGRVGEIVPIEVWGDHLGQSRRTCGVRFRRSAADAGPAPVTVRYFAPGDYWVRES